MSHHKKRNSKKIYIAVTLLVIICVVTAAVVYAATQPPAATRATPGVSVGDTFTYSIKGQYQLFDENIATPDSIYPGFTNLNNTESYTVKVTAVNGTSISLDVNWKFLNGTEIPSQQTIDLSNGQKTDKNGFFQIYCANLNLNDKVRPNGADGAIVNSTSTKGYQVDTRAVNEITIENEFLDIRDQTQSTYMDDYRSISFDRQTGMLVSFVDYIQYNNPSMTLVITYTLTSSSAWAV